MTQLDPLRPVPAVMIRVESYRNDPNGLRPIVSTWVAAVPRSVDILHRLSVEVDGLPVLVESFRLDAPRCAMCGGPLRPSLVEAMETISYDVYDQDDDDEERRRAFDATQDGE